MPKFDPDLIKYKPRVMSGRDVEIVQYCTVPGVIAPSVKARPSWAAWWGIFLGRFLEYMVKYDRDYALEYIESKYPKLLSVCSNIDTDSILALNPRVEVALALDTRTQEVSEIKYDATDANVHLYSRLDLLFTGERVHVADYKSGKRQYDPAKLSQLLSLGVKVWIQAGRPASGADVSIINVISPHGELRWSTHTMTVAELEAYAKHLRRVHLSVLNARADYDEDGTLEPVPGKHCRWCDLREMCPVVRAEDLKDEKPEPKRRKKVST